MLRVDALSHLGVSHVRIAARRNGGNVKYYRVVEHSRVEMQKCTHMFERARAADAH